MGNEKQPLELAASRSYQPLCWGTRAAACLRRVREGKGEEKSDTVSAGNFLKELNCSWEERIGLVAGEGSGAREFFQGGIIKPYVCMLVRKLK